MIKNWKLILSWRKNASLQTSNGLNRSFRIRRTRFWSPWCSLSLSSYHNHRYLHCYLYHQYPHRYHLIFIIVIFIVIIVIHIVIILSSKLFSIIVTYLHHHYLYRYHLIVILIVIIWPLSLLSLSLSSYIYHRYLYRYLYHRYLHLYQRYLYRHHRYPYHYHLIFNIVLLIVILSLSSLSSSMSLSSSYLSLSSYLYHCRYLPYLYRYDTNYPIKMNILERHSLSTSRRDWLNYFLFLWKCSELFSYVSTVVERMNICGGIPSPKTSSYKEMVKNGIFRYRKSDFVFYLIHRMRRRF